MILEIVDIETGVKFHFDPIGSPLSSLNDVEKSAVVQCLALGKDVTTGKTLCRVVKKGKMPITKWAKREGISRQRAHVLAKEGRLPCVIVDTERGPVRMVSSDIKLSAILY